MQKKSVNPLSPYNSSEKRVAATGVSGVAVPAARWHEKERWHRCKRRRHCHRRKLDVVLACRCCNRREGGSWLTQWETRPPGKYPLMPAKLPHSRTSLWPRALAAFSSPCSFLRSHPLLFSPFALCFFDIPFSFSVFPPRFRLFSALCIMSLSLSLLFFFAFHFSFSTREMVDQLLNI